ncbi:MAG: chorion class high-cysteine HCB protein 13 [Lachnospiraceae bacterium]|nr:chorion class high-cysteine HCB protein 13 [Lachnospiraceae bacterium]
MGNLSSGCGCGHERMSCGNDCCSIIWIILLLSIFCGGNNGFGFFGGNGCGCDNDCCGNNSCIWLILLLLFCGNGFGFNSGCGCGCGNTWNNSCGDNCGC